MSAEVGYRIGSKMSDEEITSTVLKVLTKIAPEADIGNLAPDVNFRDQFDFDSVDFLNFALSLQKELGVNIPEHDYPKLSTLQSCISFLGSKADDKAG